MIKILNCIAKNKLILIVLMLLLFSTNNSVANPKHKVKLTEVLINSHSVLPDSYDDIVIAETDTIFFRYELDFHSSLPFMFNLRLIDRDEVSERSANTKEVSYTKLHEGN
jgi:hypothetical protein